MGNIRAVDRLIWSAIGNTTNLAGRLHSLTREVQASIVIDAVTWERAGEAAVDFVSRPSIQIRGLEGRTTVYIRPL